MPLPIAESSICSVDHRLSGGVVTSSQIPTHKFNRRAAVEAFAAACAGSPCRHSNLESPDVSSIANFPQKFHKHISPFGTIFFVFSLIWKRFYKYYACDAVNLLIGEKISLPMNIAIIFSYSTK